MFDGFFILIVLSPHIPHASDQLDTKKMVIELLNADAHTDVVNNSGDCPHAGYLKSNGLHTFLI